MFRNLITILISVSASLAVTLFVVKVAVLPPLGAFTTLNSTDVIRDFPTTYNANLAKTIEVGTTSIDSITTLSNLVSHGTTTTGGFQGSIIAVAYGGTGSTTFGKLQNAILISNTTNGVGSLDDLGTSGQFLTSRGVGSSPHWTTSAIDLNGNYIWRGANQFIDSTTTIDKLTLATTTNIAGAFTVWPRTNNASTTYNAPSSGTGAGNASSGSTSSVMFLANNGLGLLGWVPPSLGFNFGVGSIQKGQVQAQVVRHGLGRMPQFIQVEAFGCTNDGSNDSTAYSVGYATSSVSEISVGHTNKPASASAVTSVSQVSSTTIVSLYDVGPALDGAATLSAMDSSTFTLNWTTNNSVCTGSPGGTVWQYVWYVM